MKILYVSAGILIKDDNSIFLAQRPQGKSLSGLWEFPGGKLENGETPEACLVRELHEEIDVTISKNDLTPFTFITDPTDDFYLVMFLFICRKWKGTPKGHEGQNVTWVAPSQLNDLPHPKADKPIIEMIQKELA